MTKIKWYQKLLIGLVIVVLSPLLLVTIIIAGIYILYETRQYRKIYKKSRYYLDFKQKFMTSLMHAPEYRFYNSAISRDLPIQYIKQYSNGFEYFIFKNTLYIFPDFEQIDYDEEKSAWQVDYDGDWSSFEEARNHLLSKLETKPHLPVRILVERAMFPITNLSEVTIPECIDVTWEYERAFEDNVSPLPLCIPQSSKDLYDMMLQTPDLRGHFELLPEDDMIVWHLYEHIYIELGVDLDDCYIGVLKDLPCKNRNSLTHWHPTPFEIYNEVCRMGKPGNVMVLRTFLSGGGVQYVGKKEDCPYPKQKRRLFGKIYYLEAK